MMRTVYTLIASLLVSPALANTSYSEFNTPVCPSSMSNSTIRHAKIGGIEKNPHYNNRYDAYGELNINGRKWQLFLEAPEIVDSSDQSLVAAHQALHSLSDPYAKSADLRVSKIGQIWVCEYFSGGVMSIVHGQTHAILYTEFKKSDVL